jgi:FMN phosphatase YigB (HAD superfamily)
MREIRAVTFDFWNTLMFEERGSLSGLRLAAWAGLLEEAGFATEREQIGAVFESSWRGFNARWSAGEHVLSVRVAEEALEALGYDVPPDVRAALLDAFTDAGMEGQLFPAEGVGDAIAALRDAGIRLGIICDVGLTPSRVLRHHLDQHGLLEHFDHWSFSDEVGCFKPDPRIFEHALAGLGDPDPAAAAHIGDIRRTDIAGAQAMGMLAVRYAGLSDDVSPDQPEGDVVIRHHAELAAALGVGGVR